MTMKSITSITLTLLIAFLVASCNRSAVVQEPTPQTKERVIYLGCEFPGDGENTTRMEISHPDLSTPLKMLWQSGDQLQIGFKQDGKNYLATAATVQEENIRENRSVVRGVPVTVPEGIDTHRPYTIYLAYGPDGTLDIASDNFFYLQLPKSGDIFVDKEDATTTAYYANKKLPILYAKKEMNGGEENFSCTLQHLGSFFVLHLANLGIQSFTNNYWCKLEDVNGYQAANEGMYVWNNGYPDGKTYDHFGSRFNLEEEQAIPTLDGGKKAYAGIVWDNRPYKRTPEGEVENIAYVWYPVTPNVPMPALRFMISYQAAFWGSWCYKSETALPAGRTLERGKVYHFYVTLGVHGTASYTPKFSKRDWTPREDVVPIS